MIMIKSVGLVWRSALGAALHSSDKPSVRRPWIGCECPCYGTIEIVVVIIIIIIIIDKIINTVKMYISKENTRAFTVTKWLQQFSWQYNYLYCKKSLCVMYSFVITEFNAWLQISSSKSSYSVFGLETAAHYCPWGVQPFYQYWCF